jgi:hypothetical protein
MARTKVRDLKKGLLREMVEKALEGAVVAEFTTPQLASKVMASGAHAIKLLEELRDDGVFQILQRSPVGGKRAPWIVAYAPTAFTPIVLPVDDIADEDLLDGRDGEEEMPDPFVPSTHEERVEFLLTRLIDEVIDFRRALESGVYLGAAKVEAAIDRSTTRQQDNLERSTAAMAGVATEVRSLVKMWS